MKPSEPVRTVKMHEDEIDLDASLAARLVAAQFPRWAGLPVERLPSAGTENAMFRLGADMVVRMPRYPDAVRAIAYEQRVLTRLGPLLSLATPVPLALGGPGAGYPWPWSVYRWLEGRSPVAGSVAEPEALARDLGGFVRELRRADPSGGPAGHRGVPLAARDTPTREAIARLAGRVDTDAVTALWERALRTPEHPGPPVWAHADLAPGNVLVRAGRLSAVIDFGCAGVGDPAIDLIPAWNLLPAQARGVFRAAVGADDAQWARGRGWALSVSLIQLPYYWHTNPPLAENSRHVISEILAEAKAEAEGEAGQGPGPGSGSGSGV